MMFLDNKCYGFATVESLIPLRFLMFSWNSGQISWCHDLFCSYIGMWSARIFKKSTDLSNPEHVEMV